MHTEFPNRTEVIYLAGGCLWGVQEFVRHLPGVVHTEAGRANGSSQNLNSPYDGYAECVMVHFDPRRLSVSRLMAYFFEIIDPYSFRRQGPDIGEKYRTGVYSQVAEHLREARAYIAGRADAAKVRVEVRPLSNYLRSDEAHQDRLTRHPEDECHLPRKLLHKYK